MSDILAQIVLAVGRNDTEGTSWMNILVLVVLAVFYGLGSILKARANKLQEQEREQQQPGRKPEIKPFDKTQRVPKTFPKTPQAQRPVILTPPRGPRPVIRPAVARLARGQPAVAVQKPATIAEIPEAQHLAEILSDYADPDELTRAILHYEILGKPLSLRQPSERIS